MQTYWDLTEKERAALSREDVEKFGDAELMTKGVLKVKPLELEPEPAIPEPAQVCYRIRVGGKYSGVQLDVGFATLEGAQTFLKLRPLHVALQYVKGKNVETAAPIDEHEIFAEALLTADQVTEARATIERRAAVENENQRRTREHEEALKKQEEALSGMWADWLECREKDASMRRVVEVFDDYVRTAGDEATAAKFLRKVFTAPQIAEASEWTGVAIPAATEDVAA